jgi:hypothetical protein
MTPASGGFAEKVFSSSKLTFLRENNNSGP